MFVARSAIVAPDGDAPGPPYTLLPIADEHPNHQHDRERN